MQDRLALYKVLKLTSPKALLASHSIEIFQIRVSRGLVRSFLTRGIGDDQIIVVKVPAAGIALLGQALSTR